MITIKLVSVKLSDASRVFDLHISDADHGGEIVVACISESAARELAETFRVALNKHTVEVSEFVQPEFYVARAMR